MKKIITTMILAAWANVGLADDFDVTMDVISAGESFDEAIVNRIALPFASQASERAMKRIDVEHLQAIEELDSVVNDSLEQSAQGESAGLDSFELDNLQEAMPRGLGNKD